MSLAMPSWCFRLSTLLAMIALCASSPSPVRDFPTAASLGSWANELLHYLRVASLSIALYDYLATLPAEFRLYASQPSFLRMSNACILFIAVRYVSVVCLVASSWGFFGTGFSPKVCQRYYLVTPATKLLAVLISQIIISIRTYAISRKSPWVFWTLCALFIACLLPELVGTVYKKIPVQDMYQNCTSGNIVRMSWLHYLAAVVFDVVTTGISTTYLLINSPTLSPMSGLSRLLLKEGMSYFFVLTLVNLANLYVFRTSSISTQSCAAGFGEAMTMIMSEHIILNLHDWRVIQASTQQPSERHEMDRISGVQRAPSYLRPTVVSGARGAGPRAVIPDSRNRNVLGGRPSRNSMDDPTRAKRSSRRLDPPLEIRVQIHEAVKIDYESDYEPSVFDIGAPPAPIDLPDEDEEPAIFESIAL
ncbi:hypothetical protein BS47DRAFT_1338203 [Hydnum rufescens UP504]|uniref:DUF6533 domain-containing protein n=1 Tax=Hydnum rufescens UP504 TaxID=1448309 RepID=A0A9P6B7R5_9AGAM|nr:hypothetical protein BS47DRAFT_1338203 [Hydnum rufescens UP504]